MTDEAKWIIENLPVPEKGVFVEVGAFDGVEGSNTLPFEQKGWSGLCIEADPMNANKCALNRNCHTLCAAIGTPVMPIAQFKINVDDRGLSGLERPIDNRTRIIWTAVVSLKDAIGILPKDAPIDLLSIDTEGTELNVWSSIGTIRPKIVIMEYYTIGRPRNDRAVLNEMIGCGYKMVWENNVNMIFTYEK